MAACLIAVWPIGRPEPDVALDQCVYATAGWGIHDERWVTGLVEVGYQPSVISLGRDVSSVRDLRLRVAASAGDGQPVLAGPLHTVTHALLGLGLRLVGLSWGYDLADAAAEGRDLSWLAGLPGLIVDSRANVEVARVAGLSQGRITLLPWGIDLSTFAFHDSRTDSPDLGVPADGAVVLSLRAHEEQYRVEDIVRAFAEIGGDTGPGDAPYLVIGHSGSLTDHLRRVATDLGIVDRTRFVGTVPEADLAPLMGRASCYVTASQVDGTSVTMLQAMACGTPVIASATPGNLGWVRPGVTGYAYPTGDVAALAAVMAQVLSDRPAQVVQRARALVETEADWHANLDRLRRALDDA